jgi:hypothetical protein
MGQIVAGSNDKWTSATWLASFLASSSPRFTKGGWSERSERTGNLMSLGLTERYPLISCVNRHLASLQSRRWKHDGQVTRTLNRIHKSRLQQLSSTSPVRLGFFGTAAPYSVLSAFSSPPALVSYAERRLCEASLPESAHHRYHRWSPSVDHEKHDLCSLRRHRRPGVSGPVTRRRIFGRVRWRISRKRDVKA